MSDSEQDVATTSSTKPPCQYGASCYRKNAQHLKNFSHPPKQAAAKSTRKTRGSKRSRECEEGKDEGEEDEEEEEEEERGDDEVEEDEEEDQAPRKKARTASTTSKQSTRTNPAQETKGVLEWSKSGSLLIGITNPPPPALTKVASFDLDSTLVEESRKGLGLWNDCVPDELQKLVQRGYTIAVFSNQKGLDPKKLKTTEAAVKRKAEIVISKAGVPAVVLMATQDDEFRKPRTGMWDYYVSKFNRSADVSASFYCGDAAGRPADPSKKRKKDFEVSDRKFAFNSRLPFHTPEEFFLGESPVPFDWRGIDPVKFLAQHATSKPYNADEYLTADVPELIIMVGWPGSGKSTFVESVLVPNGYKRINRDTLKTAEKCLQVARKALEDGHSVVIDNTSPSKSARAEYVSVAKEYQVPVRCFKMGTEMEVAKHNNFFRAKQQGIGHVPEIGFRMFKSKFEEPDKKEGFKEIQTIAFSLTLTSQRDIELYSQFT